MAAVEKEYRAGNTDIYALAKKHNLAPSSIYRAAFLKKIKAEQAAKETK